MAWRMLYLKTPRADRANGPGGPARKRVIMTRCDKCWRLSCTAIDGMDLYALPGGRRVRIACDVARGQLVVSYTLGGGKRVNALRVDAFLRPGCAL